MTCPCEWQCQPTSLPGFPDADGADDRRPRKPVGGWDDPARTALGQSVGENQSSVAQRSRSRTLRGAKECMGIQTFARDLDEHAETSSTYAPECGNVSGQSNELGKHIEILHLCFQEAFGDSRLCRYTATQLGDAHHDHAV